MDKAEQLLRTLSGIAQEKKLLKCREEAAKAELQSLYELGEIGEKVALDNVSASLSKTTTWAHSQSVREDITKLRNIDIELGMATKRETFSWTVRVGKPQESES